MHSIATKFSILLVAIVLASVGNTLVLLHSSALEPSHLTVAMAEVEQEYNHQVEEDVGTDPEWISIDELANHGISASDVKKLKEDGTLNTIKSVITATKKDLLAIRGISEAKVRCRAHLRAHVQNLQRQYGHL
eukprot:SAG11_NODE_7702_length_1108_cov_0.959366_1_plen_133_part_00